MRCVLKWQAETDKFLLELRAQQFDPTTDVWEYVVERSVSAVWVSIFDRNTAKWFVAGGFPIEDIPISVVPGGKFFISLFGVQYEDYRGNRKIF